MLYPTELRAAVSGGRGEEIRTPDILLPKQARYRAALHPAGITHYKKTFDSCKFFREKNWISVRELLRQRLSVSETGKNFGESADGVRLPDTIFPH